MIEMVDIHTLSLGLLQRYLHILYMDFDTYMIVQITYLKGKNCAAIKIHNTRESQNITLLALQQVHGCRIYPFIEIHLHCTIVF